MVITFIKSWKNRQQQQLETGRSKYKVYDDYFVCEENLDGGYITTKKIYFSEIDKIHETDRFLLVVISNQVYILKKSDLINNSAFYLAIHDKPAKFMDKEKIRKLTLTANVFFAMSLIVAITAAVLMFIDKELRFIPWLFLSPLPLSPFICTVFGFTLKRKGCKYKKHIAAGVISVLVLLSTGSFSGLLADFHDPVKYLTDVIGIDMPEISVEQNVISYNYENQPSEIGFIFYHTKVEFEEFSADYFEDNMIYDTRWLTSLPDELKTALKPIEYNESHKGADRIMLYNEFTGEFNTRPEDSELQSFIAVFYFTDENRAEIFEYEYDLSPPEDE